MIQQPLSMENALSKLSPKDQMHCQQVFERYKAIIAIHNKAVMYCILETEALKALDDEIFTEGMKVTEQWNKQLDVSSKEVTTAVIDAIEGYFRRRYKLNFKSFKDIYPVEASSTAIPDHTTIIYNILRQDGPAYYRQVLN